MNRVRAGAVSLLHKLQPAGAGRGLDGVVVESGRNRGASEQLSDITARSVRAYAWAQNTPEVESLEKHETGETFGVGTISDYSVSAGIQRCVAAISTWFFDTHTGSLGTRTIKA